MVMPSLPSRHIYDVVDPLAEEAAMVAGYRALYPSWQPAETDPLRLVFRVAGARLGLFFEYQNAKARGAFPPDAVGTDQDGVCETFGTIRRPGEDDASLERRRSAHMRAIGRSSGYSAYIAEALTASPDIAGAAITQDVAPSEGRVIVNLLATETASEARSDNLLGVPSATTVAAVQAYLRDPIRVRVGDEQILCRAASPTEYRIAADVDGDLDAARAAAYAYIDSRRGYNQTLRASNLITAMETAVGVNVADVTLFNVQGSTGIAVLAATGATYYDCAKNDTGVALTTLT